MNLFMELSMFSVNLATREEHILITGNTSLPTKAMMMASSYKTCGGIATSAPMPSLEVCGNSGKSTSKNS